MGAPKKRAGSMIERKPRRSGRALFLFLLFFGFSVHCYAQNTLVTATVTDPNGFPYAFATGQASIQCPGNQQPTYGGAPVTRTITIVGLDGNGHFTLSVWDVNMIQPTGCSWKFFITYQDGITSFITGNIPGVTGSTVDLSSAISAYAVVIPNAIGKILSCTALNGIAYQNGQSNTLTCNQGLTWGPPLTTATTGGALPSPFTPQNQSNLCGSSISYVTAFNAQNHIPCTMDSMFFGGQQIPGTGFGTSTHVNYMKTELGVDVQSALAVSNYAVCAGNNSGNFPTDNSTNCVGELVNAASSGGSSSNPIAFNGVAQCFALGSNQSRTCEASQLLTNAQRSPGWFGGINTDYSLLESYVIQGGSNDVSVGTFRESSDATHGYLFGDITAAAKEVGHAQFRGANGVSSKIGDWCADGSITCYYVGAKPWFSVNPGNHPSFSDLSAWGSTMGERGTVSAQSTILQWISTPAGSGATIASSPTGATSLDHTITYTTSSPHGFTNDVYHPIHITGVTSVSGGSYNIDCVPISMTSTTFTCWGPYSLPNGTTTAASVTSNVATLTMTNNPTTAGFDTSQGIIVGAFSGADTYFNGVYTPTSVSSTQIQYSLTHADATATTNGTVVAQGLPASGSGTATQSTEQSMTAYLDSGGLFHFGYQSPPNPALPDGTDTLTFDNNGNGSFAGTLATGGNITATATSPAIIATTGTITARMVAAPGGAAQFGSTTAHEMDLQTGGTSQWRIDTSGNIFAIGGSGRHINQNAANGDYAGVLTCSSSTISKSFTTAFNSTPVIMVSDETTAGGARVSTKSGSGFTVTCTGASDVVDYMVIGNPN